MMKIGIANIAGINKDLERQGNLFGIAVTQIRVKIAGPKTIGKSSELYFPWFPKLFSTIKW